MIGHLCHVTDSGAVIGRVALGTDRYYSDEGRSSVVAPLKRKKPYYNLEQAHCVSAGTSPGHHGDPAHVMVCSNWETETVWVMYCL